MGEKVIFERPAITREDWRRRVAEAAPLSGRLPSNEALQMTARWAERWDPAVCVGWGLLEVPGVRRRSLYLRTDHGDGWGNLAEYQEAANRLVTAIRNFVRANQNSKIIATDYASSITSHWPRVAFPTAKFWRFFEDPETQREGGALWVDSLGDIKDLHVAVDLALLGIARFAIMNENLSKAIVPYEGWVDYLHSLKMS